MKRGKLTMTASKVIKTSRSRASSRDGKDHPAQEGTQIIESERGQSQETEFS